MAEYRCVYFKPYDSAGSTYQYMVPTELVTSWNNKDYECNEKCTYLESNKLLNKRKPYLTSVACYPRYQSRTSTWGGGGVCCQKWQFLYFYGHHQKQFLCTHDLTGIQDQCHWTMKCFPLRKSLMRNMCHRTRWFTMTLVSTGQGNEMMVF